MGTAARALGTGVWSNCAPGRRPGPGPRTTVWTKGADRRPGGGVWLNGMLRRPGRCSVCSLPRLGARAGVGETKKGELSLPLLLLWISHDPSGRILQDPDPGLSLLDFPDPWFRD